ncbi:probable E3 ubiquitin-protein ligase HERC4 [Heptranchias perlo]|uniref:probable E3 ubiquitin-protein ligase HERC4 n=1 Tax=Heptranchias perlo TaxID=212740 RepID=UPI0035593FD2
MLRWGEMSCRQLGSKTRKDRILSQVTYSGEVFEKEDIQHICCRGRFSAFVLSDGSVYTLVNEQRWRGKPEQVNGLEEDKINFVDSGTSHILFVSEAGNLFFSKFQNKKRGVNAKPFSITNPQLLRHFAGMCVIQVACGNDHSLALCKDGQLFAWGQNTHGQLGLGAEKRSPSSPQCVKTLAGIPLAQVAAGGAHSFALSVSGAVFGWGRNNHGQLGLKDTTDRQHPSHVKLLECKKIVYISCGGQHTAVLTKDGLVLTFGAGRHGQLGHHTKRDEIKPRLVGELFGSKVSQIACGSYHTLVLVAPAGKIYSFGRGENGQLGNGRTSDQLVPRPVTFSMDIPDAARLVPAVMSHSDSGPTVPQRRKRMTRAASTKANTHKRTIGAPDLFTPTGAAAKKMRISGAPGATPNSPTRPVANGTKSQRPTATSRKYLLRSHLTKCQAPQNPQAKEGKEQMSSSIMADRDSNMQDCIIQPAVRRIFAGANQGFALCFGDVGPVPPEDQSPFISTKRIVTADESLLSKWSATVEGRLWENTKEEINHIFSSAASLNGSFLETSKGHYFQTSKEISGLDMSAVTVWFEKLGRNPTLLQEVTKAVENNLISSLPKSPAGVEALRVYLILPELIAVLTERNNIVKLTGLLSTAIVSLEESKLEILESWWNNLNEFFFKKLVIMYKSASHQLLRETSREQKEFPGELHNCLNILQRLYKVNSSASLKIQENNFYIHPAEVFGNSPISCRALLQLIPHLCIFNIENKIKIFQRVSHLKILGGKIIDETIIFDNNRNSDDLIGNTDASNGNTDDPIGNTDASNGNIDASNGNPDASNGNIDASNGNTDASNRNTDASNGNIDASNGNTDASNGNTDASNRNINASNGNINASNGNTDASVGNTDASNGNTDASVGNTDASVGNTDASVGNTDASVGNTDASVGNTDASNRNTDASNRNTDASNGNINASNGNTDASNGNTDAFNGNTDASNGNTDASVGNTDASVGNTDASVGNTDASNGNIDASNENIDASNGNINASNGSTDASNGNTDASNGNTDASVGNTDASVGNTDASGGNIDASIGNNDDNTDGFFDWNEYDNDDYDDDYYDVDDYDVDDYDDDYYDCLDYVMLPVGLVNLFAAFGFPFPQCFLRIKRTEILQNTLAQLRCCTDTNLRGSFQVMFKDEMAIDEGGVSQEFFSVITRELCTQPKIFKHYEESRLVWFPEWDPEIKDIFHHVGILCWLALYHGFVANFHFPSALYKKLLNVRPTLDDLKELSPILGRNLQELLNYEYDDVEEIFCLDFTIRKEMDDGSTVEYQLIPNGKNVPVQKHNRKQFVDAYVDYVFNTSVERHFKAFSGGFRSVFPLPVVDIFLPHELMAVVHGNTKYDWQLLEEHTKYKGYTEADKAIVNFWEMFHELPEEQKKHFLAFLTGCDRVPVGGMGSLSITIRCDTRDDPDWYYPAAHTCSLTLDLPRYSSTDILREKFLRAIASYEAFGIA